ncbi:hypothetical protein MP228_002233 [Amoeboaphelidium protococcarum]|nr:hypothetical protein MP228_002233 [Amoeboaphelidium protococcarum]
MYCRRFLSQRVELPSVRELVNLYRGDALKEKGQNFIFDMNVTDKIVFSSLQPLVQNDPEYNPTVIEIGCGPGGLTRALLKNDRIQKVIGVEVDQRFEPILGMLQDHYPDKFKLLLQDANTMNEDLLIQEYAQNAKDILVIGNLPFLYGTKWTMRWLEQCYHKTGLFSHGRRVSMALMYQSEVARQVCESHGHGKRFRTRMGTLSQIIMRPQIVYNVPASVFVPKPKVDAAVVLFQMRDTPMLTGSLADLQTVLRFSFADKRKVMLGAFDKLAQLAKKKNKSGALSKVSIEMFRDKFERESGISPEDRPICIPNESFIRLAESFGDVLKCQQFVVQNT